MKKETKEALEVISILKEYFELNDFNDLVPVKNVPIEKWKLLKKILNIK